MRSVSWPSDLPASSHAELRAALLSDSLTLGVAKDHAKDWWTQGEESTGRGVAALFVYLPILIGVAVIVAAIRTQNWGWLIAIPLGLLTMFFGSPMNPAKRAAVIFGFGLLALGWFGGWSSLVVAGIVVLAIYVEMQVYYGLGKRAFRRFLANDPAGFAKYWMAGIVMLRDPSGQVHMHDTTEERLSRLEPLNSPP